MMEGRLLRFAGLLLLWTVPVAAQQPPTSASAPAHAEKLKIDGLPNLGRVSPTLYRGGQPKKEGFEQLKALGIQVVVDLREASPEVEQERRTVESLGMRFVSLPWPATRKPDPKQVAQLLELVRSDSGEKVFVHCRRGAERTGVMMASYRITQQGWTPEQALEEMEEFGFRGFWFRSFKKFVRDLPALLQSEPVLRPFAAPAQ